MKQTSVQERRKFDEDFKREAVLNWLRSGKSAMVVGEELDRTPLNLASARPAISRENI
jgi:transposase-like protein